MTSFTMPIYARNYLFSYLLQLPPSTQVKMHSGLTCLNLTCRSNTFWTIFSFSSLPPELNLHHNYFFRKNRLKIDKTSCIPLSSDCTLSEANSVPSLFLKFVICMKKKKRIHNSSVTYSTEGGLKIIYPPHGTVTGLIILKLRRKLCILLVKLRNI